MRDPRARIPALAAVAAIAVAATGLLASCEGSSSAGGRSVHVGTPCGTASPHAVTYSHVVWIWMENHSYGEVIGSPQAPYLTKLGHRCGIATNFHNITHPSLPNYIAATSGLGYKAIARFESDCDPSHTCSTSAKSVFEQAPSWRAYQESMPEPCQRGNAGLYAVRHNPPPYYRGLHGCGKNDVPFTELAGDLAAGTLPAFSFITPNLCHDTHDCSVSVGDRWLAGHVPAILDSPLYRKGRLMLVITYDEGSGGATSKCASNRTAPDCRIAAVVVSPSTSPGTRSRRLLNHYSLLRTTESLLGLRHLGRARSATSMAGAFDLPAGGS